MNKEGKGGGEENTRSGKWERKRKITSEREYGVRKGETSGVKGRERGQKSAWGEKVREKVRRWERMVVRMSE